MMRQTSEGMGRHSDVPGIEVMRRLAISESGFVFDPVSGHSFIANETGHEVLRLLQRDMRLDQVLDSLEQEYEASPRELERDVLEFIGILRKQLSGI
ncbi:MAG: PqqD family protein [Pseudomonadota bacterium]|nr:PqqD family protein [Pseudomonadota bacterium]